VLIRNRFCAQHEISPSTFNRLIQDYEEAVKSTKDQYSGYQIIWSESGQCYLTKRYRNYLGESIGDRLRSAEEAIDIQPSNLSGTPPFELLRQILGEQANAIPGRVQAKDGQLTFVPYGYLVDQRDKKLQAITNGRIDVLTEGDVSGLDLKSEGFKAFVLDHLKGKAILLSSAAISYAFLDRLVEIASLDLEEHNFATLPVGLLHQPFFGSTDSE
jgi:hypothetical protein